MNISKNEQRVLHVLAQGGLIRHLRDETGRIVDIHCVTREGYILSCCTMDIFTKLRKKRLIESRNGKPYRIALKGRQTVQAQADNR